MGNGFLAAKGGDDLRARVKLDVEAVAVEPRDGLAKLGGAVVRGVLVRGRVAGGGGERAHHGLRGRQVGVSDPEADHVDPLAALGGNLALELGKEVGRHLVEAAGELHQANSSESSSEQISSAGPVSVARPPSSSTARSPPGRCTVTGLSHQPRATATAAAATELVPDESVSPAPRSQTPTVSSCGPSTRTSWTLMRSGKRSWFSTSGPSRRSSSRSGSRRITAWGFPTETGVTSMSSPATSS